MHNEYIVEFEEKYIPIGCVDPDISYEDNFCVEYKGEETLYFYYVEEDDDYSIFDRQIVE